MAGKTKIITKKSVKKDEVSVKDEFKTCSMQLSDKCIKDHTENGGRKLTDFYMVINNNMYKASKIHICKDCIKEYIYKSNNEVDLLKFKKILQVIDVPFLKKEFESAIDAKTDTFGAYYKNIALNHLGKCYEDGDREELANVIQEDIKTQDDLVNFWGSGFVDEEYDFLEDELSRWKQTHKCDVQSEITLLREICITVLDIRNARKEKAPTKDLRKELQELMKTASVDPAKANAISGGQTVDRWGVWLKDIEQKKPSEWWEDQEKYKDMDGFVPYIKNYILRPIKNFFTGVKDFMIDGEDLSFKDKDKE